MALPLATRGLLETPYSLSVKSGRLMRALESLLPPPPPPPPEPEHAESSAAKLTASPIRGFEPNLPPLSITLAALYAILISETRLRSA